MRAIQVYGFGDTGILLTTALNRLGLECDLLLSNKQSLGQLPRWTKQYKELKDHVYVHRAEDAKDPFTVVDFTRFVNSYDVVHLHQPAGMYGDLIKRPFHIFDGGSSMFLFPPSKIKNVPVLADKAAARRSYKKAKLVHANDINMLYQLFLPKKWKNVRFTPLPVDTDMFRPMKKRRDKRFTIYLPSRQENQQKGTYDILEGIKLFIMDNNVQGDNVLVQMPLFGSDASLVPHWIKEFDLEENVQIIPLLSKPKFAEHLNKVDVVIDQLRVGGYGGVGIQAMSCAKTVIVNAWRPWYQEQLGDVPPILYAKTAFDVSAQLLHAYDFYERKYWKMGEAAREYAVKHHDYMKVAEEVLASYEPSR